VSHRESRLILILGGVTWVTKDERSSVLSWKDEICLLALLRNFLPLLSAAEAVLSKSAVSYTHLHYT
jgi:hypothetical protein